MKITDEEKLNIKICMLVNGYDTYETDYFNTDSYKKLRSTMLENLPFGDENRFRFDFYPKAEILKAGRFVIDKHFGKLDLRVPYANGDDMESQLIALFGKQPKPSQYDDIIEYINNQIELVRVTDIPVGLNLGNLKNGYVANTWFYGPKAVKEEFYEKVPVCVREIVLDGDCDEGTKEIYVHELGHALINRYKGNINNLLNAEAFSIFMEKVSASDLDSSGNALDFKNFLRIIQVKHCLLEKEIIEFREEGFESLLRKKTYILSSLYATALFDTYNKGSKKLKSEIDDSLGEVITGKAVLEDVFDYYDVTAENGSKIMQRQIKKYDKKFQSK